MASAVLACACAMLYGCTGCGTSRHASPEEMDAARLMAHTRAMELAPDQIQSDTLAIENALIDIRERETRLRSAGYDDVADEFIATFLTTLDSINPSLARELR